MLPQMSMGATRRQAMAGAAAAGIALPLAANAASYPGNIVGGSIPAPYVEIFDSRGCEVSHNEYTGSPANAMEDEQCVKVSMLPVKVTESFAAKKRAEFINFKQSSINVEQISGTKRIY